MTDNAVAIRKGLKHGLDLIIQTIIASLHNSALELIDYAIAHKEYIGFTGNTQTSYMCGIYLNGSLHHTVTKHSQKAPIRRKIKRGQFVFLKNPYEGDARGAKGAIDTDDLYGYETSINFLKSYTTSPNKIGLVMTTGTEYSVYLEELKGLDVLTNTYEAAKIIIGRNWKPIPK